MKTSYLQQRNTRQQNTSALLFDLWWNAPLSRAMLAQRNSLTKATVSAICDDLVRLNLICDVGQDRDKIGRPGNLLELNPQARGAIGLEISTNYVAILLTDLRGQPVWREIAAIAPGSPEDVIPGQAQADVGREASLVASASQQWKRWRSGSAAPSPTSSSNWQLSLSGRRHVWGHMPLR